MQGIFKKMDGCKTALTPVKVGGLILALGVMPGVGCKTVDTALLGQATVEVVQAITLSDAQIEDLSRQAAQQQDSKNTVAASSSAAAKRLQRLAAKHLQEDGLSLNYKVYDSDTVNAFAMADGTIRFYTGLMDKMTDHELLFVLGHEIGHVKLGHSKKAAQVAYGTSAARKGAAAVGGTVGALAQSELGMISEKIVNAQFSQYEEKEADDYGLAFMRRHGYPVQAAVDALNKLGSGGGGLMSSHPDSKDRAARLSGRI